MRLTNSFVHWILHAPIETNEAHGWQKLESPDQESLLNQSAGFRSFLVYPMTIQHMECFLPISTNNVFLGKMNHFFTALQLSYRRDSGEDV